MFGEVVIGSHPPSKASRRADCKKSSYEKKQLKLAADSADNMDAQKADSGSAKFSDRGFATWNGHLASPWQAGSLPHPWSRSPALNSVVSPVSLAHQEREAGRPVVDAAGEARRQPCLHFTSNSTR